MKARYLHEAIAYSFLLLMISAGGLYLFFNAVPELGNQVTGMATQTVSTRVNVTPAPPQNCDFTLYNGLNLVSFYCLGDFHDLSEITGSFNNLVGIFEYDPSSPDKWNVYGPNLPSGIVTDLSTVGKKKGYWVKVNGTSNFFFEGIMTSSSEIEISAGYYLYGYPSNKTKSINESLQSINGSYSKVVGFDPVSKTFQTYVPSSGSNTLTQTEPGKGYWINGTGSDTWVVTS